jgi:hypothetical protein
LTLVQLGAWTAVLVATVVAPVQAQSAEQPRRPAFRFSREAGDRLRELWNASVAAKEERVACLASSVRNDTVYVTRVAAVTPEDADSLGISAIASIDACGPPEWSGTVHTHIALYTDDSPSTKFSAQDRIAMRLWYDRWHADGVFCVIYSRNTARCEADGVLGGLRTRPRVTR